MNTKPNKVVINKNRQNFIPGLRFQLAIVNNFKMVMLKIYLSTSYSIFAVYVGATKTIYGGIG